jgi:hypothetical protein
MSDIRLLSVPTFKRSFVGSGVREVIMEVDGMLKSSGPKFGGETRAIE